MAPRYPTLVRRYYSTVIDTVLLFLLVALAGVLPLEEQQVPVARCLVLAVWVLLYEPLLTSRACTLGQLIMDIRVRKDQATEQRITFLRAFGRYLVKALLGIFSFFTLLFMPRQRAIHDLAVGSVVIRPER